MSAAGIEPAPRAWRGAGVAAIALGASMLVGCAFDRGDAYGVVEGSVDATYEIDEDRALDDGFEKTSANYAVRFDALVLTVDAVGIVGVAGESAGGTDGFDPANPPDGYGLCHNGHCHRDDGALVSYEEIEASLAGGTEGAATLLTLLGGDSDSLSAQLLPLSCEGPCLLPQASVGLVRLTLSRLSGSGKVRDQLEDARFEGTRDFSFELDLTQSDDDGAALGVVERATPTTIGEDTPKELELAVHIPLTVKLVDGIDFSEVGGEQFVLDEDEAALARLRENFLDTPIEVVLQQGES